MRSVRYRVGRILRAEWRTTLMLTVVIAAVSGTVFAVAIGAERTGSAPARYTASQGGGFDAEVQQDSGPPRTAEVAGLPGVETVEAATFVFGGLEVAGRGEPADALVFAGSRLTFGGRLVAGREPLAAGEFVATRTFAEPIGAEVGTRFNLRTLSAEQADRLGFEAFEIEGPRGASLEVVMVGLVEGPAELHDPTPFVIMAPSLLDHDVGISATIMSVILEPGTTLESFRGRLDSLPDGTSLSLNPSELINSELETAVNGQALGLWVLAAIGAVAAIAALSQLVTRTVRITVEERPQLRAVGLSRGQILAESVGRAAVPILVGSVAGAGLAAIASAGFPTGFVRRIEPHRGMWIDPTVLGLSVVGMIVGLITWNTLALVTSRSVSVAERPSPFVESVATRSRSASLSTGLRFAFTSGSRDRGTIRASVTGMLVITAVLVGAFVFGSSLNRLISERSRFGYNFDHMIGSGGELGKDTTEALAADDDVAAVLRYAVGQGRVGTETVRLAGMDPVKGDAGPAVLSGRLPTAEDEVALGRLLARSLGARVGSDILFENEMTAQRFRVTGLAVIPAVEGLDGVGKDAIMTIDGLKKLDPGVTPSVAAVVLRTDAPDDTAARLGIDGGYTLPGVIVNLERVRSVPFLVALLIGALTVLTVVHVMVMSVRARRRDFAILRALGADDQAISRAVRWQATTFSMLPLVLAAPFGLIIGRVLFEVFANSIGAVPDASFPFAILVAQIGALVVLANVVAIVVARRARRLTPALLLNPE